MVVISTILWSPGEPSVTGIGVGLVADAHARPDELAADVEVEPRAAAEGVEVSVRLDAPPIWVKRAYGLGGNS